MPHWKEYDSDGKGKTCISVLVNYRLWNWIEQTRGKKSRSRYIRNILTEAMENA